MDKPKDIISILFEKIDKHESNKQLCQNISEILFEYFYRTLFWSNFNLNCKKDLDSDWQILCYEIVESSNYAEHVFLISWFYSIKNQSVEASLRSIYKLYFKDREEVWQNWKRKFEKTKLNLLISYLLRPDDVTMESDIIIKEPTPEILEEVLNLKIFNTRRFIKSLNLNISPYIKTDWIQQLSKEISLLWLSDDPNHMKYASAYHRLMKDKLKLYYCLNDIRINGLNWFLQETFGNITLQIAEDEWEVRLIETYTEDEILDIFSENLNCNKLMLKNKFKENDINFVIVKSLMYTTRKSETLIRLLSEQISSEIFNES